MANPPFNLDISDPTDGALGNAFPANERAFRDNVNSYLNTDHDATTGHHKFPLLTTTQKNALTTPPAGMLVFDTTLVQLQTNLGTPSAPVWAPAVSGLNGLVVTTSGSFTIPSPKLKVTISGAGGGGGGGISPANGGNGASGGWLVCWLTGLTIGATLTVTIGTGGSGGVSSGTPTSGANGSDTILASGTQTITTRTSFGGGGGFGATSSSAPGVGGTSGGLSTGAAGDLFGLGGSGNNGVLNMGNPFQVSLYYPYGAGGTGVETGTAATGFNGMMFFEWVI